MRSTAGPRTTTVIFLATGSTSLGTTRWPQSRHSPMATWTHIDTRSSIWPPSLSRLPNRSTATRRAKPLQIRLWRLGSLEHKLMPTPKAFERLREVLQGINEGEIADIIWDQAIDLSIIDVDHEGVDVVHG